MIETPTHPRSGAGTATRAAVRVGRVALTLVALGLFGCGRAPSIGDDKAAFQEVDALFTAVSLRDAGQLDRCESRLHDLKSHGKLPDAAAARLDAIVAQARSGGWTTAQSELRSFMLGQRQ